MQKSLLSVGIDLGTTTTQVIFSRIYLENRAVTAVPEIKITKKEVVYQSAIYFTPLLSAGNIDLPKLKQVIEAEYQKAGIKKADLQTGAVIITGETARKENAAAVLQSLADFAGDFVVATAGPDLESLLAGLGAGAAEKSRRSGESILNFDIGGGTTNAALFSAGEVQDMFALDIGGRLLRLQKDGTITYVSEKLNYLLYELGLKERLIIGKRANFSELCLLTKNLAEILYRIVHQQFLSPASEQLFIGHTCGSFDSPQVMISGGVAEYVYTTFTPTCIKEVTLFGDMGPLLGAAIRDCFYSHGDRLRRPREKIRATVIGAGSHSLHLSGSTVWADETALPIKNLPVLQLSLAHITANAKQGSQLLKNRLQLFPDEVPALSFLGEEACSYSEVKTLAMIIAEAVSQQTEQPLVVLLEADFAKALGITLKRFLPERHVICLDRIRAHDGDYIDIGSSIGSVVPVIVKTLIFTA